MTLYGQNLEGASLIEFINSEGTTIAFISDLSYVVTNTNENLTFVVPATIANALLPGTAYQIRIVTPQGTTAGVTFVLGASTTLTPVPATPVTTTATGNPVITSISPNEGTVGTSVTIYGQNLAGASMVNILTPNNQIISSVTIPHASSTANENLTFTIPTTITPAGAALSGEYQMEVVTPGGTSNGVAVTLNTMTACPAWGCNPEPIAPVTPIAPNVTSTPGTATSTEPTTTSAPTPGTAGSVNTSSTQMLQLHLDQLIATLLQLLQQASQQGLLSVSQLNSFLSAISMPQASSSSSMASSSMETTTTTTSTSFSVSTSTSASASGTNSRFARNIY